YEVLKFSENLFRDWVWGEAESDAALALVRRLLDAAGAREPLGTVAGFGAGAGRLAVDLHRTGRPAGGGAGGRDPPRRGVGGRGWGRRRGGRGGGGRRGRIFRGGRRGGGGGCGAGGGAAAPGSRPRGRS